jgi:DNA-binding NarL/FixJ family response regulator
MKVLIVDDDSLICKSLSLHLSKEPEIVITGTAMNGSQAVSMCEQCLPEVILMDIRMPEVDGIQATRIIKKRFPAVRILMLTTFQDKPNIQMALQAGAEGYLLKTDRLSDIAIKVKMFGKGITLLDGDVLKTLTAPQNTLIEKLTKREKEVMELVCQGFTNKEIAEQLFLSEGTVRNVITVILEKCQVKNRTQLSLLVSGGTKES